VRLQQVARFADMQPMSLIADRVIVHTERNRAMLLERAEIPPERISVIGIGTPEQPKNPPTQAGARARLGIPAQARVVLFFGLIKVYKGLMTLIDAMAEVRAQVPDAYLLIAGQSEEPLAPYTEALKRHGLTDATTTHFGFVPSEAMADYFAAADVVCLPYREASQSAVLFDAYRYAKAVAVTRVGGLPEVVEEGGNGFVVPPDNAPALAEALTSLLADPAKYAAFGRRSLELAQTRYSWAKSAEQTEQVYRDAIAAFRARKAAE
jgi:glycosyltransferase involved in cell wall biosynthesis